MTTYHQSLMHFVKGVVGAGLFSMGVAFKNGGVVFALIATPLMGLLVLHCITLLIRCVEAQELKKKSDEKDEVEIRDKTYAQIVEEIFSEGPPIAKSFAGKARIVVNVAICTMNLGFCCVYIVFVGNNMGKALQFFDIHLSVYIVMLIFIIPIWLSSLIVNLKWLAPVSTFANLILLTALGITFYYVCRDTRDFHSLPYVARFDRIPLFMAVVLYSYDIVALVVPLRNEMNRPEQLTSTLGVFNVGFVLIVIPVIVCVGFFSYLKYGDDIEGTIFLNLPEGDLLVQVLLILVCVQVLFSYAVQFYVPVTIMWPMIVEGYGPFKHNFLTLLCFRTVLVLITLAIAEAIPFIDLIISLIGAICSTCLTLFIPVTLDVIVNYGRKSTCARKTYLLMKNGVIAILAVLIFVTGVYTSVVNIIHSF